MYYEENNQLVLRRKQSIIFNDMNSRFVYQRKIVLALTFWSR